jgi:insertion element IS1 protein InsB
VERTRIFEVIQPLVDQAVRAKHYFSDGFPCYADVYYHGALYQAMLDKSQTYSVEGDNAELRHYLARLHRRSRCYSKCVRALQQALALFVESWNRRQLKRRAYPNYVGALGDFISVRV